MIFTYKPKKLEFKTHSDKQIKVEQLRENFLKLPLNSLRNFFKFDKIIRKLVKNLKILKVIFAINIRI